MWDKKIARDYMVFKNYSRYRQLAYAAGAAATNYMLGSSRGSGTASRQVQKFSRSYTASGLGKRSSDNGPVTSQYDVRTWYKKKKMPRRRRKAWKKFKSKVQAVLNKEIAPTYFLYRTTTTLSSLDNQQGWGSLMLYTAYGGAAPNNDLYQISVGLKGALGNQIGAKYRFESACLDVLLRNKGTNIALIDVYTVYCRADLPDNYASPYVALTSFDSLANQDNNADPKIADTDIGYTPFTCPLFCSFFKVVKKRTLTLSGGAVTEMQMRDAKNRKLWGIDYVGKPALRGWTKGYMVCVRGAYDSTAGKTPAVNVDCAYTRHYCLRQLQDTSIVSASV